MGKQRRVEPTSPRCKETNSLWSTSRDVNMDISKIDACNISGKKVRNPLTPLTPRIDINKFNISKIDVREKTKIIKVRNPLTPLTPRVAIPLTDVQKPHKNENVEILETISTGFDDELQYSYPKRGTAKKYASFSEESNCEEQEPFVPSESEYHPSDSDSVFELFDEKFYTSDSEQNVDDDNESVQRSNIFTPSVSMESNSGSDINAVITVSPMSPENTNIASSSHQYIIPTSKKKWSSRYHFCPFCRERVTRFARHVLNVHKTEPEVIEINVLPPNNLNRLDRINVLRKKGMYEYNTNAEHNRGDIIVNRRPKIHNKKNPYIPCKNCKGYYRTSNLPKHYKMCSGQNSARGITRCGRMLSKTLLPRYFEYIESILKKGRTDNLSQIILKDNAILYYGAKLASRYMHVKHMDNHIRSNMRLMARLLISLKRVDPSITCLIDAFKPSKMETLLVAVRDVCQYDQEKRCFKNPSAALHFSGILLKCCEALLIHFIQNDNENMRQQIDNFRSLVKSELSDMVRMGHANLVQNKLTLSVPLPLASDICKLNSYLRNTAEAASMKLEKETFSFNSWHDLASCTLVLLLIFNRRRTGETERLSLNNYNAKSSIVKGTDIYESLEQHEKILSKNFYRLEIRGKWGCSVPVLLTKTLVSYIDQIISLRETAGVAIDNPYVFGIGAGSHLSACKILRDISTRCGAKNPNSLRGTYLRKQIATVTQIIDMSDSDIKLLSQFMGHSQLIHEQSYRKTDATLQIARLSKLLIAFNEGQLNRYKGCSLDQLDIDLENEALVTRSKNNTPPTENSIHDQINENDVTSRTDQGSVEVNSVVCNVSSGKKSSNYGTGVLNIDSVNISSVENSPNDFISNNNASEVITPKKRGNYHAKRENCRRNLFTESRKSRSANKKKNLLPKLMANRQRIFVPKVPWTTTERQAVHKLFTNELKMGVLPPFTECAKASLNEPALRRRSGKMIYAYINNINKINKK